MATLTNNDLVALDAKMFSKHRYKKVLVLCEDCFWAEQTHGVGIHNQHLTSGNIITRL